MVKLPRFLIILFDGDFTKITEGYNETEKNIGWIIGNILITLGKRKKQLSSNYPAIQAAFRKLEPKIIFIKPTTKPDTWSDDRAGGRNQRRIFNRCSETVLSRYEEIYFFNVDEIRPDKTEYF